MPCYRCGARQVDPPRGPSLWKRGVRSDQQVLICPECQTTPDWSGELDHCGACGSPSLVRMLGATHCRGCGTVREGDERGAAEPGPGPDAGLSGEVQAALDRVLRPRSG